MKYLCLAYITLKKRAVYKFDIVMGYIMAFVMASASKVFWEALAAAGKIPYDKLQDYITYSALTAVMGIFFSGELISSISDKIRSGNIVSDLQKPLGFQALVISSSFGSVVGSFILDIVPKFLAMVLILKVYIPASSFTVMFFTISFILGAFIMVAIDYLIGLLAFYFVEMLAFVVMKSVVIGFCAGLLIPLWLFPKALLDVINMLPFSFICFLPINIYLEKLNYKEMLTSIGMQLCWLVALLIIGKIMTSFVLKKVTIAGG